MNTEELIGLYLEGQCTEAQTRALQEALKQDPALRRRYLDHLNLETALEARSEWSVVAPPLSNVTAPLPDSRFAPFRKPSFTRMNVLLKAAAGICMAFGGFSIWHASSKPYALVVECPGVSTLSKNAPIRDSICEISAGTVELQTARGARVVLEAPAKFRFESAVRLHLFRGRLSADVPPPARGFTVITASGEAVDLGTRFGVDVPEAGPAEVHVFQGEVREQSTRGQRQQSLKGGEAVIMDHGVGKSRTLRSSAFILREEVAPLQAALSAGQPSRAARSLEQLRQDPALITLLDFESVSPGNFQEVQGRWPGSKAIEFREVGQHLPIHVGADKTWPELTLAAWVRLDRVGGGRIQSLFHTDGWDRKNPGQIHWSVTPHGTLWLVCLPFQKLPVNEEKTPRLPEQGRWVHLASSYDSTQHRLRHYLDGKLGLEMQLEQTAPAVLGAAQLGNWDQYDRNLSGRIDEFLLMGRILDPHEITDLFESGTPYR